MLRSNHPVIRSAGRAMATGLLILAAACTQPVEGERLPEPRLEGVLLDMQLSEVSGLAASRQHEGIVWLHDDGDNPARLFAVNTSGRRVATFGIDGVTKTDWEDIAAFELEGRHYLLLADTGDNGGLRRTLQLHVIEEPGGLTNARLTPAWSLAFRWPDGARDCEAVAVDAERGEILLVSKKREPPELFTLPLRPGSQRLLTARPAGLLAGVPNPTPGPDGGEPSGRSRYDAQVTAASVSPDRLTLAVMTYRHLLLYSREPGANWTSAVESQPATSELPWLPQAEALGWSADGSALYATGEFIPAPLYRIPAQPAD